MVFRIIKLLQIIVTIFQKDTQLIYLGLHFDLIKIFEFCKFSILDNSAFKTQ